MSINKLFRKAKTIKKPSFPLEVTKCFLFLVTVCVVAVIVFIHQIVLFIQKPLDDSYYLINRSENEFKTYIDTRDEVVLNNAIEQVQKLIPNDITYRLEIDGEVLFDGTDSVYIHCYEPGNGYFSYIGKWDQGKSEEYKALFDYVSKNSEIAIYLLTPRDIYVDAETGIIYPGVVDVTRRTMIHEYFEIPSNKNVVATYDLTPDASLISDARHIVVDENYYPFLFISAPSDYVSEHYGNSWYTNSSHGTYGYGNTDHRYDAYYNLSYANNSANFRMWALFWLTTIVVIIISFISGSINYFKNKSIYEIFEYRRRTTEAMAHDLKTPLTAISLSASNLKENLGVNMERCESHASDIESTVAYANEVIENILVFSKSETSHKKLNITPIDMREELTKQITSVEPLLKSNGMEAEILGGGIVKTDLELWNQATMNLIVNSIKHGSKGSKIRIGIESSEETGKLAASKILTIINSVDEDIDNPEKLIEPFVKGSASRGENSGSGLGLSIVNNNLITLGYNLKVECKDKIFIVTISR